MLKSNIIWLFWEKIYDKNLIFENFKNIEEQERLDRLIYDLYYELWYLSLMYLWLLWVPDKEWSELIWNRLKQLDLTLKYLYPLLKEWKLKVRIMNYELEKEIDLTKEYKLVGSKEYKKEEVKKAIIDIRKKWLSLPIKERESFEMSDVEFTLPENKWRE